MRRRARPWRVARVLPSSLEGTDLALVLDNGNSRAQRCFKELSLSSAMRLCSGLVKLLLSRLARSRLVRHSARRCELPGLQQDGDAKATAGEKIRSTNSERRRGKTDREEGARERGAGTLSRGKACRARPGTAGREGVSWARSAPSTRAPCAACAAKRRRRARRCAARSAWSAASTGPGATAA